MADTLTVKIAAITKEASILERFLNLLKIDANGCWLFRSPSKRGYANFGITKRFAVRAHRYAYEMYKGPIPTGLHIDHLCSVKNCCNPDHLEAVTPKENTRRAWARGEAKAHPREVCLRAGRIGNAAAAKKKLAATHCKRGHPYSPENTILIKKGGRDCKACRKIRGKNWYEKNKCQQ